MARMNRSCPHPDAHRTVEALLDSRPDAIRILGRHGMACAGCAMAPFETLAEAAREYRLDRDTLLRELLEIEENPPHQPKNRLRGNGKMGSQNRKSGAKP
jgi:hybrid cluster-associated redox disulfide protein